MHLSIWDRSPLWVGDPTGIAGRLRMKSQRCGKNKDNKHLESSNQSKHAGSVPNFSLQVRRRRVEVDEATSSWKFQVPLRVTRQWIRPIVVR